MSGAASGPSPGASTFTSPPKTLRNSSSAPGKTGVRGKYASKACQECRRRRAKCDGVKPTCSRCTSRQVSCVYTTEDDGRGTAPKSYVRLLQARIGVLEKILWLHSIDIDASAAQLMQQGAVPEAALSATGNGSNTAFDELCDVFEGVLSLDESQNFDQDGEPRYFGPASGRLEFRPCNDMHNRPPKLYSSPSPDTPTMAFSSAFSISEELETHLLELYFTWEQPWLQAVDEALFRESKRNGGRYFSPLLLNCLLAAGSRFSDRLEVRSDPEDANTAGYRFLDAAAFLLQIDLKWPSITTIQSLAVLGTVYHAFGQDAAGWLHSGMAHRLILDMGLNQDSGPLVDSGQMTMEEAELRRQIYWSLYTVDKLAAGYTGRVCSMLDFQATVSMPKLPTHAQPDDPRRALYTIDPNLLASQHVALIKLCQILEKIFLSLYAPKPLCHDEHRRRLFDTCTLWLKSWYYGLTPELKLIQAGVPNKFPQAYTLAMSYHTIKILLVRPYIQDAKVGANEDRNQDDSIKKATNIFLEAAREISAIGDRYRQVFGTFRRSPITATYCNLSAALALLNPHCRKHHMAWSTPADNARIRSCMQTLEELSTAWTPPGKYHCTIMSMLNERQAKQNTELQMAVGATDATEDSQPVFNIYPNPSRDEMGQSTWTSMLDAGAEPPASSTTEPFSFQPDIDSLWELFDWNRPESPN